MNIKKLHEMGHIIGLHSYYHPTLMENKSYQDQKIEYSKNLNHLETIFEKTKFILWPIPVVAIMTTH